MTLHLGSHVSMNGKKMLLGSSEEAISYGANTFMVYTGAPQNTRRKPIEELNIEAGRAHMKENGIDHIIVHAPYIINIGNSEKPATFKLGVDFLQSEIERTQALGADQIVLHPGAHVGAGVDKGIEKIIEGLNEVLTENDGVQIALETMAGKGSECGRTFEEIARIINGVTHNDRLSVCFDTCHTHDAGYNIVEDFDGVLNEFDKIIGVERIKVLHINDSKNPRGAAKDRHENIGFGHIGFKALHYIVHHPQLQDIPKILETPYVGEDKKNKKPPYKFEIDMIRNGTFHEGLLEKIVAQ
ncbi:deoxyribonuclease IV [Halalkalibacterium halodurans]|uniref:Probable endonuclease 4 n=1 Tax=Halalkalibacterium halodurans (strain ATCC BAA-125 / DSM 18197 / FERM 7344 / JCM 9153 / C-125) TaxID=272558 RepID=END4_HALH5|nr:deoxyribonuclease IV [Halalkalibacterium halodurans]Q9KD33.1 RecName: Full=Probable endonuclease 4; AltName: Full=Endodeoxyribonuclease IV; AltName: Full=Endonuclease IV [Halalkalibacterium halodurans C-125]MED4081784.1 deoxyribonuclease IV [Halalkalibacterium halodurans]MED4087046.1 deoxyribonuclease IV [Halalkalibacterium halodurans]MED4103865.1 deoxyribonuclease IV [Halalkalibacterium halodurans]MED4110879.1 deoxyribonuclease IV [Halalkalibacterium halodurans]MED4124838.1 deoxyribonucle